MPENVIGITRIATRIVALVFAGCSLGDVDELREDLNEQAARLAVLESGNNR